MAVPMTADQLVAQLRRWGVSVTEHPGWRTNNRAGHGAWGPVNGSMVHHTASGDGSGIVAVCYDGRPDLPGPLCHGVIHKDGTVTLVGNGRANHAGAGAKNVYDAVVAESAVPRPGPDVIDGNAHFYGWECVNLGDGNDPWPDVQVETIARVQAAVCEFHTWSAQSVIGHLEWTTRKTDPRGFTMVSMRALTTAHLKAGPSTAEDPVTTVDLSTDSIEAVAARVLEKDGVIANPDTGTSGANPFITLSTSVRNIETVVRRAESSAKQFTTEAGISSTSVAADLSAILGAVKNLRVTLTDAQVTALASSPVLSDAIAEKVAAKLAARLQS